MELRPIGLVTCSQFPGLSKDDEVLRGELEAQGLKTRAVVWDDPAVDWGDHSGLLFRSCWDYHLKLADFTVWLETIERRCIPVWNPLPTVRWNLQKTYLKACAAAVPTVWLAPGQEDELDAMMLAQGWEEAVVKPLVAAGAHNTRRVRRGDEGARAAAAAALAPHGAMLQPFIEDVTGEGEWSFIFIDGIFTHAVLKRPAPGDFRVQEEHGGTTAAARPGDDLIEAARRALACVETPWLYARVDGLRSMGSLMISEIELIEPSLYFQQGPAAAKRLADSLKKRL
jgi:glutathione synthase/RimK-type ligase-like ATP-grasp enzyme